jgi:hypothetical protein
MNARLQPLLRPESVLRGVAIPRLPYQQIAAAAVPLSACVIAYAICSTLNRFRFIVSLPNRGRNHPRKLSLTLDQISGSRPSDFMNTPS